MAQSQMDVPLGHVLSEPTQTKFNSTGQDPNDPVPYEITEDDGSPIDANSLTPDDPLYGENLGADEEEQPNTALARAPFEANLAEFMDDDDRRELGSELIEDIENDLIARKEWGEQLKMAVKELGLRIEPVTEPWDGAASIVHSMLLETVIRFQAEAVQEIFNSNGPAKALLTGDEPPPVADAANRISADINTLMTGGIPGFRTEHERMLFVLGLCGVAAKQIQFDPVRKTISDKCIPANDLIMPWDTTHLSETERYAVRLRLSPSQFERYVDSGFYWSEKELPKDEDGDEQHSGSPDDTLDDEIMRVIGFDYTAEGDGRVVIYQADVEMEIECLEQGVRPWLVSIRASDGSILAVYRNWKQDDPTFARRTHTVKYGLVPAFGAYDLGYAHMLLSPNKTATDTTRALIDAGSLNNLPAGYKTRGMKIKGDNTPLMPGELRDVDVPSGTLRDNIVTGLFKEPSQTLYNLRNTVAQEGRGLAAIADLNIKEVNQNTPVGTTLALLERSLKPITAIQGRLYDALLDEITLLRTTLEDYLPMLMQGPLATKLVSQPQDYAMTRNIRIVPTVDPVSGTMTQRIAQFQSAYQLSQGAPQLYNLPLLHRSMLQALGLSNAAQLVPDTTQQAPMDPVAENMAILNTQPVQAFEQQDHEAHLRVHIAARNDPMIQQMVQQSPSAQAVAGAMDAHIRQHVAYAYKRRFEQTLGQPLPQQQSQQIDAQLAPQIAQAADQLLQRDTQEAQAQIAQQNAQDPVLQATLQQQQNAQEKLRQADAHHQDDVAIKLLELLMQADKNDKQDVRDSVRMQVDAFLRAHQAHSQSATQLAVANMNQKGQTSDSQD